MLHLMSIETTNKAKRGRRPLGDTAMSPAERKRRSRELLRASGVKEFSLQLQGLHLEYVERVAIQSGVNTGDALRAILESALDRYVGVMRRCALMLDNGATEDEVTRFMSTYWMPELPPMPELASDTTAESKLGECNGRADYNLTGVISKQ